MTAVEWLLATLEQKSIIDLDSVDSNKYYDIIKQAKQMEKEQIMKAYYDGQGLPANKRQQINYYNDTYGNKGSDERIVEATKTIISQTEISINELKGICQSVIDNTPSDATEKEIGYTKAMEHIIKIIDGELHKYPQTEISDEEIKNAALKEYNNNDYQYKHWEIDAWISACKWYREQLKSKQ